jgi:hypothetical protein
MRASALAGLTGLIMSASIGAGTAVAHPGEGNETDADHAKEDLAGTSIVQIEKDTAAKAAKIKKATGSTPGRLSKDQNVANAKVSAAAAQDPGQGGSWSSVIPTDQGSKVGVVPIFQAVLPNGKVLMWDSVGQSAPESMPTNNFTRVMVWDPTNNSYKRIDVSGYNIFCAGYTQLADGNVLVAGGNKNAALDGIVQTHLFNWQTETWSGGPDMAAARWYPAVQALGNNEAVIVGGGPAVPEVYQTDKTLRKLATPAVTATVLRIPDHQAQWAGRVDGSGHPDEHHRHKRPGAIAATKARDNINRTYGGFATYDIGKVLVAGRRGHYRGQPNSRSDQDRLHRRCQRHEHHDAEHHGDPNQLYVRLVGGNTASPFSLTVACSRPAE